MKNIFKLVSALILCCFKIPSCAGENLKIAIVDNFKYQKYVTTKYKKFYLEGLILAIEKEKNSGLHIEYKIFQYNQDPMSVLQIAPKVLDWNPDVIIGPRDSNKFLVLSPLIKNRLTISPFATSLAVVKCQRIFLVCHSQMLSKQKQYIILSIGNFLKKMFFY